MNIASHFFRTSPTKQHPNEQQTFLPKEVLQVKKELLQKKKNLLSNIIFKEIFFNKTCVKGAPFFDCCWSIPVILRRKEFNNFNLFDSKSCRDPQFGNVGLDGLINSSGQINIPQPGQIRGSLYIYINFD